MPYAIYWCSKTILRVTGHGKPIFRTFSEADAGAKLANRHWPGFHHHVAWRPPEGAEKVTS